MPSGAGIAPPRCHPPPDGGTLRHVNNSLPGPVSEGSVHGNGSRQPDNWLLALAEPFVTVLAHGNGVTAWFQNYLKGQYLRVLASLALMVALACLLVWQSIRIQGIFQGSSLGPVLFCAFVNDLSLHAGGAQVVQYADDTQVIVSGPKSEVPFLISRLEHSLS